MTPPGAGRPSRAFGRGFFLILLLALLPMLSACASETVAFERPTPAGPLRLHGTLWMPEGRGGAPVPALILSHGSGGLSPNREPRYAAALNAMGVAVLAIDHFGPRAITSTVRDQSQVSASEMRRDAFAALDALVRDPRIRADRIGIAGFSKGGIVTISVALARNNAPRGPNAARFALHVAFYPGCSDHWYAPRTTGAPIRLLLGEADTYTGLASCLALAEELRAAGAALEVTVYPGAQHGFDGFGRDWSDPAGQNFSGCRYEEQADGTWIERTSGVALRDAASRAAARRSCMRFGVSGGPDPAARAASLEVLKAEVARVLLAP